MSGTYFNPLHRVFLNLSGGTVTGNTLFTQSVSAATFYSGSTNLSDIFAFGATASLAPTYIGYGGSSSGLTGTSTFTFLDNIGGNYTRGYAQVFGAQVGNIAGPTYFRADQIKGFTTLEVEGDSGIGFYTNAGSLRGYIGNNGITRFNELSATTFSGDSIFIYGTNTLYNFRYGGLLMGFDSTGNFLLRTDQPTPSSSSVNGFATYFGGPNYSQWFRSNYASFGSSSKQSVNTAAYVSIAGSVSDRASLSVESGVTVNSPYDGDIWNDGAHLYGKIAGVVRQLDNDTGATFVQPTQVVFGSNTSGLTGNSRLTYSNNQLYINPAAETGLYVFQDTSTANVPAKFFKAINAAGQMYPIIKLNRGDGTTITPDSGVGASLSFGLPDGLGVYSSSEDNVIIGGIYDIQASQTSSSRNTAFVVQTQSAGTLSTTFKVSYSGITSYRPLTIPGDGSANQILARVGNNIYFQDNISNFSDRSLMTVGGMIFSNAASTPNISSSNYLEFTAPTHFYVNSPNTYFNDSKVFIGTYPHTNTHNFEVQGTTQLSSTTATTLTINTAAANYGINYLNSNSLRWSINVDGNNYFRLHPWQPGTFGSSDIFFEGSAIGVGGIPTENLTVYGSTRTNGFSATTATATTIIATYERVNLLTATTISASTIQSDSLIGTTERMVQADTGGTLYAVQEIVSGIVTDPTAITLLTTASNWNMAGIYTGTTITNTYQGQFYGDTGNTYVYLALADNYFARIPRV